MRSSPFPWLRALAFALTLAAPLLASAQTGDTQFARGKLDQLTAQVALYPDSLLSQVLMASTYPADVAVKMVANEPWDPSVQSLVAFPQVIIMMGEKPDWVRDLGDAFPA